MEVKVAGYRAPQYGDPAGGEDIPSHYDLSTGALTGNYPYIIKYLLNRFQAHATLTHNKENFIVGDHQFKAGVAYSRFSGDFTIKTAGGLFYYDNVPGLWPGPGLAISQGWNQVPTSNQVSFFVQDSWSVTRNFTLNPGIRFEIYRGYLKHLDKTVIKASDFLPRIGFTWDIFGDHKTALKAHYGKYNERLLLGYFEDMDTGYDDNVTYLVLPTGDLVELSRIPLAKLTAEIYSIDPNIKQPTMHEFTAGIDRELISDLSFGLSFIYRKWTNFIDQVNTGGMWEPLQVTGPDGQVYTVYNRLNPGADKYYITNPEPGKDYGQAYKNIVSVPVWRKYTGVEFLINKKFSNKWQLLASYVYSKATGTLSNGYRSSYGKAYLYKDPNNQILAQGHLEIDPTHMLKIQGTAVLPLEFNLTGNFSVVSGRTWAKTLAVGGLAQGVVWIPIEPRGSERLPTRTNLDFRVEKTLNLKNFGRIGIMFDMFNAFNSGVETGLIGAVNQSNYGLVTGIVLPRRYRLGIRFFF
jgi:outer membrane receptor protein involved in Fe transport